MNTLEHQVDRAAEIARDADIDSQCDAPDWVITDADYPPSFVYDAESWHSDCAQTITSMDADANDYIRQQLAKAIYYINEKPYAQTPRSKILTAQCLNHVMTNIGGQVIENAIKNGLTIEKIGSEYQ